MICCADRFLTEQGVSEYLLGTAPPIFHPIYSRYPFGLLYHESFFKSTQISFICLFFLEKAIFFSNKNNIIQFFGFMDPSVPQKYSSTNTSEKMISLTRRCFLFLLKNYKFYAIIYYANILKISKGSTVWNHNIKTIFFGFMRTALSG